MRDRGRARSGSNRALTGGHNHGASDHDARHKVASLTAQLIQKDHRIRGLEQGVQSKLAEVPQLFFFWAFGGVNVSSSETTPVEVNVEVTNPPPHPQRPTNILFLWRRLV